MDLREEGNGVYHPEKGELEIVDVCGSHNNKNYFEQQTEFMTSSYTEK